LLRQFRAARSRSRRLPHEQASALLESVIRSSNIPSSVTNHVAFLLIKEALSEEDPEKVAVARSLLSMVQQRYPDTFQRATKVELGENEELRQAIDQLSLSMVYFCVP